MPMRPIYFKSDLFSKPNDPSDREMSRLILLNLAHALARTDQLILRFNPDTPSLYDSGVKYHAEEDVEEWCDINVLLRQGWGDCEDLACWRIAELRREGRQADPLIKWQTDGKRIVYHMLVHLPDEGINEDPSRILGMGTEAARMPLSKFIKTLRLRG